MRVDAGRPGQRAADRRRPAGAAGTGRPAGTARAARSGGAGGASRHRARSGRLGDRLGSRRRLLSICRGRGARGTDARERHRARGRRPSGPARNPRPGARRAAPASGSRPAPGRSERGGVQQCAAKAMLRRRRLALSPSPEQSHRPSSKAGALPCRSRPRSRVTGSVGATPCRRQTTAPRCPGPSQNACRPMAHRVFICRPGASKGTSRALSGC